MRFLYSLASGVPTGVPIIQQQELARSSSRSQPQRSAHGRQLSQVARAEHVLDEQSAHGSSHGLAWRTAHAPSLPEEAAGLTRDSRPRGSNEKTHSDPAASSRSSSLRTRRQGSVSTARHTRCYGREATPPRRVSSATFGGTVLKDTFPFQSSFAAMLVQLHLSATGRRFADPVPRGFASGSKPAQ